MPKGAVSSEPATPGNEELHEAEGDILDESIALPDSKATQTRRSSAQKSVSHCYELQRQLEVIPRVCGRHNVGLLKSASTLVSSVPLLRNWFSYEPHLMMSSHGHRNGYISMKQKPKYYIYIVNPVIWWRNSFRTIMNIFQTRFYILPSHENIDWPPIVAWWLGRARFL